MNTKKNFLRACTLSITTAGVLASSTAALAAPTVYSVPGNRLDEVVNNSGAIVIGDSKDPNTLWVLPPSRGETITTGRSYSANVGYCESMALLQDASAEVVREMNRLMKGMAKHQKKIDKAEKKLEEAKEKLAKVFIDHKDADILDAYSREIDDLATEISDLRTTLEDCDDDVLDCDELYDDYKAKKAEHRKLRKELRKLRKKYRKAWRAYKRADNKVEHAQERVDRLKGKLAKIVKNHTGLQSSLDDMYAKYAKLEGGFANIDYISGWDEATQRLRDDNPDFSVRKIETREARMNMSLVPGLGSTSYLASLPMVLDYSLAGASYDPKDAKIEFPAFPGDLSANVRLSLVGACPGVLPDEFDLASSGDGMPLYGLTVSYAYPSVFRVNATATFNLWSMYEVIKKHWKKGGFFSSSSGNSTVENEYKGSVFSLTIDNDGDMTADEKQKIREEIISGINQQILTTMGTAVHDPQSPELTLPTAPDKGAVVFSKGIKKTCGFNIYCKGASWILNGLSAIFGSTSQEASFKSKYDLSVTRTYNESDIQYRYGIIGFNRGEAE